MTLLPLRGIGINVACKDSEEKEEKDSLFL